MKLFTNTITTWILNITFDLSYDSSFCLASNSRGVSKGGGAGGAIAPPLFGTIEGAAGDGATPHYYLYYYLPPHFKKLLTPLITYLYFCYSSRYSSK